MKFKLDENLSPTLASLFSPLTADVHSVEQEALNGRPDEQIIEVCQREQRALITFDLDFSNILVYPPSRYSGIIVLRLRNQSHQTAAAAVQRIVKQLPQEPLAGMLWIVEEERIRIHE